MTAPSTSSPETVRRRRSVRGRASRLNHRPWPRFELQTRTPGRRIGQALGGREGDLLALWADADVVHLALRGAVAARSAAWRGLACRCRTAASPRSAAIIRRRSGWSGRSAISTAHAGTGARMRAPGSITAPGASGAPLGAARRRRCRSGRLRFLPVTGEGCTRFRSARCMPASSSPAISASPPTARSWCGWRSGSATSTRASTALLTDCDRWSGPPSSSRGSRAIPPWRTSFAFARAVEAALGIEPPPRAHVLRGVMAELERIANHLGDIGAVCNDAAFALILRLLRHPARGGAAQPADARLRPPADDGPRSCRAASTATSRAAAPSASVAMLDDIEPRFAEIVEVYDRHAVAAGPHLRHRLRQAGLRRALGAPAVMSAAPRAATSTPGAISPMRPMTGLRLSTCRCSTAGDVDARVWVRIREVGQTRSG